MSKGFSDPKIALGARDVFSKIVRSVLDVERPRYRYATVNSIDRVNRKCTVTFVGDSGSVRVSMGSVQPASIGQTVRVAGIGADRFIEDVMGTVYIESRVSALESNISQHTDSIIDHEDRLDAIDAIKNQYCEVVRNTSYTVNNSFTSLDQVNFWTVTSDPAAMHNNGIFTIPAAGRYSIVASANVSAAVATGRRILQVEKYNIGATIPANHVTGTVWMRTQASSGTYTNINLDRDVTLTAGLRIRFMLYQDSGGAYTVNPTAEGETYITIRRLL